jgi:NADH:ubiquinone oxidoreductase subunit F (NADH-binding)
VAFGRQSGSFLTVDPLEVVVPLVQHAGQVSRRHRSLPAGQGTMADLDALLDTCDNILGRSFCCLGDGATSSVTSSRNSLLSPCSRI